MHATVPKRKSAKAAPKPQSPKPAEEQVLEALDGDQLYALKPGNQIIVIELSKIKPHEHNRDLDGDESIDDLAESIRSVGQLEPATVRELFAGEHSYELISGERRFRALKKLGRETIRAVVVVDDEVEGLVRLAAANSQRKDLNPIERGELILRLMKPVKDGGSGLSREAAGKAVGLNSDGGVKNAIRMLKLPKSLKTLVASGELSERASRKLIPFVDHPELVKDIEKHLAHEEHRVELAAEEGWPYWLETAVENCCRPMDDAKLNANYLVKGCWQSYPMLFTPTEEQLVQLAPFDLKDGKQTHRLTSNIKLWDSLQKPLVQEKFNESQSPKKPDKKTAKATETKLTPAQEKSEASRKKKEANERIERFTAQWITYALRCQLAHQTTDEVRYATLGYLVQAMSSKWDVCHAVDLGYAESGLKTKKVAGAHGQDGPEKMIEANEYTYLEAWWNCMIWPEPASGSLPDLEKLPGISGKAVRVLAARCNVTMKDFWASATSIHGYQRDLLALWLGRHTTEQLLDMCQSMSLKPGLSKRSELVEYLIGQHLPNRMLTMPKGIAS